MIKITDLLREIFINMGYREVSDPYNLKSIKQFCISSSTVIEVTGLVIPKSRTTSRRFMIVIENDSIEVSRYLQLNPNAPVRIERSDMSIYDPEFIEQFEQLLSS